MAECVFNALACLFTLTTLALGVETSIATEPSGSAAAASRADVCHLGVYRRRPMLSLVLFHGRVQVVLFPVVDVE